MVLMVQSLLNLALEPCLKPVFIGRSVFGGHNDRMTFIHQNPLRRIGPWAVALSALFLGPWPVLASGKADQDRALQAVQSGEILPLRKVLERLEKDAPGQVLEVELEREQGQWVYEVKLLQRDGRLLKLLLDARDAAILQRKVR